MSSLIAYRPEIDGLRAIAVVPVILFHSGLPGFPGGFVGVDIFFVISGYLITSILMTEASDGTFSILRFYERRARRILPALFVVLAGCIPFAYLWMLPEHLKDFSASLGSVLVFLSNIYFMGQVSYFAPAAELQPLLHTWSLAVEEQYYLVFPLVVMWTMRHGSRRLLIVTVVLTLASLAFSEWGIRKDAERNFFFTLSRYWELGVGSVCAAVLAGRGPWRHGPLALFGLVLTVAPCLPLYRRDALRRIVGAGSGQRRCALDRVRTAGHACRAHPIAASNGRRRSGKLQRLSFAPTDLCLRPHPESRRAWDSSADPFVGLVAWAGLDQLALSRAPFPGAAPGLAAWAGPILPGQRFGRGCPDGACLCDLGE
ncbi:MAG: acyltransferase [Tabrizicola sp.]|nr:acyltransferase [Tabrizicola sp.]